MPDAIDFDGRQWAAGPVDAFGSVHVKCFPPDAGDTAQHLGLWQDQVISAGGRPGAPVRLEIFPDPSDRTRMQLHAFVQSAQVDWELIHGVIEAGANARDGWTISAI